MVLSVLALLVVSLFTGANALAYETETAIPFNLGVWFDDFFQTSAEEAEPGANLAYIYQNGNDNSSEQVQEGLDNRAYIYQNGDGNVAEQWQSGVGNWAGAYQLGNYNTVVTQQLGTQNWAGTYQVGNANTATIQ